MQHFDLIRASNAPQHKYIPTVFLNHLHMDSYCTKTNLGIIAMTNSSLESDKDESVCWKKNNVNTISKAYLKSING